MHRINARSAKLVITELVGAETAGRRWSLDLVRPGEPDAEPARLLCVLCQTGATIRHFDHDDSDVPLARNLATLVRLVASGRLHPENRGRRGLDADASVLQDLRERRVRGNAVLRLNHDDP
jgi:hypothetical protein